MKKSSVETAREIVEYALHDETQNNPYLKLMAAGIMLVVGILEKETPIASKTK